MRACSAAPAPPDPAIEPLLALCIADKASPQAERQLAALWQERVRHLLLDLAHDPAVFVVRDVERARVARRDESTGWDRAPGSESMRIGA